MGFALLPVLPTLPYSLLMVSKLLDLFRIRSTNSKVLKTVV